MDAPAVAQTPSAVSVSDLSAASPRLAIAGGRAQSSDSRQSSSNTREDGEEHAETNQPKKKRKRVRTGESGAVVRALSRRADHEHAMAEQAA